MKAGIRDSEFGIRGPARVMHCAVGAHFLRSLDVSGFDRFPIPDSRFPAV